MDSDKLTQQFTNLTINNNLEEAKEKAVQEIKELWQKRGTNRWIVLEEKIDEQRKIINEKTTVQEVEECLMEKRKQFTEKLQIKIVYLEQEDDYFKFEKDNKNIILIHKENPIWEEVPNPNDVNFHKYNFIAKKSVSKILQTSPKQLFYEPNDFIIQLMDDVVYQNDLEEAKEKTFNEIKDLLIKYNDEYNNERGFTIFKNNINELKTTEEVEKYLENRKERIIRENTEKITMNSLMFQYVDGDYYRFNRTMLGGEIRPICIHLDHPIWRNLYVSIPQIDSHYRLKGAKWIKKEEDVYYYEPHHFINSLKLTRAGRQGSSSKTYQTW